MSNFRSLTASGNAVCLKKRSAFGLHADHQFREIVGMTMLPLTLSDHLRPAVWLCFGGARGLAFIK